MKLTALRWFLPLLLLSSAGLAVPKDAPLIAQLSGDLWSWNGSWKRLTYHEGNFFPVLAPDGSKVAYLSMATGVPDCVGFGKEGCVGFSFSYDNIDVLELNSGKSRRIAAQPTEQNRWNSDKVGTMRLGLAWSPDSQRLAWTEQSIGDFKRGSDSWDMVLYTISNGTVSKGTTERFEIREPRYREDQSMTLHWTAQRLGLFWQNSVPEQTALRWYSTSGKFLALELGKTVNPNARNSRMSLRCPNIAGATCLLQDRARAPLKLNMHTVSGVLSADGSKAMLKGFGTDPERTGYGYQMWLYQAGQLRRIALPRAQMKDNSIELAWMGELPIDR